MYAYTRKQNHPVSISFKTFFEDAAGEEVDIEVDATVHPAVPARINADPDDCNEGADASAEIIDVRGLSRALTDDEVDMLMEDPRFEEIALEQKPDDERGYSWSEWKERQQDACESAPAPDCEAEAV